MNEHPEPRDDPAPNADLQALHRQMVALVARLDLAIDDAPDAAAVRAITEQIAAANARVTAVGRALFARQSERIASAAHDVEAVLPRVEEALADLDRLDELVASVTGVLRLVDRAVQTATMA